MAFCSKKIWNLVSVITISVMLVAAVSVQAATVTSANDTLSSLETSEAANHVLLFTTPGGIDEGDTLTISFAADFDTSTITEDDVDIEDDDIDLTTAANCVGTEKASITITADIVTITICPGNGGTIAATSEVTIEIGTNATVSGTGTNQIENPSDEGTYYVSIAGTFGDSGSIALPIGGDNSVDVQAKISGGGGGSGGGGCADHIAPIISGITTTEVIATSVTINWTTDENADSYVDYGLTASYEIGTESETSLVTSHSIVLSGLTEGTEYHFRVRSSDFCHNSASSSDYTFTTIDITAPIISNIEVTDISETSARIIWDTNEAATSVVEYGLTAGYGTTVSDGTLEIDHSVILTGLAEGATYHFRVSSADASSNSSTSSDQIFTTSIDTAPSNVSAFTAVAGDDQNILTWNLPIETDLAGVLILSCLDAFPSDPSDADCSEIYDALGESFTHTGLTNGITYYYGAFAYDLGGHYASGALAFATPETTEIPEPEDVCGDGVCNESETSDSCLIDCPVEEPLPSEEDVCGDGTCGSTETADSCPADCGEEIPPEPEEEEEAEEVCGDGVCGETESNFSCPIDCSEAPLLPPEETGEETEEVCGDAICNADETSESCPSDCPSVEIPPTTVTEEELIPSPDVSFLAEGTVKLEINEDGVTEVLAESDLLVEVSAEHVTKEVEQILFLFGSETYNLSLTNGAYSAEVTVPGTSTEYAQSVIIYYTDGTSQVLSFIADVKDNGLVYETQDGETNPVSGAQVTLYILENSQWLVWDGSPWNQFNPVTTGDNGSFAWYAANGDYKVMVQKNGYNKTDSGSLHIANQIVNPRIKIVRQELTIISATETVSEAITGAIETSTQAVKAIRESPTAQTAAAVAIPIVTIGLATSAVVLATTFNLLPFLQLLFTSPLLLFKRRKRKAYGIVYHAFTKKPVDLAIVRLYRLLDNKLVMSRVTDRGGRYFFMVQPGIYRLEVTKQNFVFPSQALMKTKDDAIYLDVYHGEPVTVSDKDTVITPNIPLEPAETAEARVPWKIRKIQLLRRWQKWLSITGLLVSFYVFLIYLTVWSAVLLGAQVVVYLLIRRLAIQAKPKSWGIVYDKITNRPLAKVIVRIFEPKYHKLLETWITDSKGRYAFILGPSQYSSTFEKSGYHSTEISPIDLTQNKDITDWAQDVKLNPKTPSSPPTNS